jgi:hypothetical protein
LWDGFLRLERDQYTGKGEAMKRLVLVFAFAFITLPLAVYADEYGTIDGLVGAYNDELCRECHKEVYEEWKGSPHSDSVNMALGGLRNFLALGVKDWYKREVTKGEVMRCLDCHAPVMRYATEELALKVAGMVVAAKETSDEKEREAVQRELGKLNVGCLGCHNIKATAIAIAHRGEPEKGAVYGVRGGQISAHRTVRSDELGTALFCMQCHGNYASPDGEVIKCNTLNGSYQDGYVSRGGSRTCQDCHMRAEKRGHRMLGGRDLALVREGIGFNVEVSPYLHLPGKGEKLWTPSAVVSVELENRAGHRIPDG